MRVYNNFRKYSDFLLKNYFEELMQFLVEEGIKSEIPLIINLKKRPEQEFLGLVEKGLKHFLEQIINNRFFEAVDEAMLKWKEESLIPGLSKHDIQISDITLVYRNRKLAFLHFLDYYTSDLELWKAIISEIEALFAYIEDLSYKTYVEIYEEKLQQEQRFFQLVINNTDEGIIAYDTKKNITLWNYSVSIQSDVPRKYALGKPLFEVLPEYLMTEEGAAIDRVLKGEKLFYTNLRYHGKDGYYEVQMIPIVEEGEVVGGISIRRDISERKKKQEEIEESRDFYLTLLNDFPVLIWRSDTKGNFNYFNNTWLKFTGRGLDKELGNGWVEGVHPDDKKKCLETHIKNIREVKRFSLEYRLLRNDGQYRWILDVGQPIFDVNGHLTGFLGACYDIQEQREAREKIYNMYLDLQEKNEELARTEEVLRETNVDLEERINQRTEELKKQNLELRKINTDLDNFIYTASHDLKAPIANIEGLVNALNDDSIDASQKKHILSLINQSVLRFKSTIHDLTEISRAQKEVYTRETVIIRDILDDVLLVLESSVQHSKAKITINLEVPSIQFSKKNFRSILYNLISNSIKFRSPSRELKIKINSYRKNDWTIVSIADNGLGINAQFLDKIFLMFKRLHDHVEGTGVGLYIVKRIMENAEGKIEVESSEGKGATFRLYFKD